MLRNIFVSLVLSLWLRAITGYPQPLPKDDEKHFYGYSVLRVVPKTEDQLSLLNSLADNPFNELDFWLDPSSLGHPVDIMVSPHRRENLLQIFGEYKLSHEVKLDDVESLLEQERKPTRPVETKLIGRDPDTFFAQYQRLSVIHSFIEKLASDHPDIASTLSIGKSTENRDLKVIKIGSKKENKPIIWIDGGIHAREWIAPATVTYIAYQLVKYYESDKEIKELVDAFDWYILPVANPDGYEYSHTNNRMWRKTRSDTGTFCRGVDPNRNWSYKWMTGGASSNPCSETYAGRNPFSEPETKAVSDFILGHKGKVKAFLAVHSYSQLWLTPWGWTSKLPDEYPALENVAKEAVKALTKVHGTSYKIGSSTNVLYAASGGADDWAHGSGGVKYAYTVELRDNGRYGFALPASQIIPTGEETWAGVKTMALTIMKEL